MLPSPVTIYNPVSTYYPPFTTQPVELNRMNLIIVLLWIVVTTSNNNTSSTAQSPVFSPTQLPSITQLIIIHVNLSIHLIPTAYQNLSRLCQRTTQSTIQPTPIILHACSHLNHLYQIPTKVILANVVGSNHNNTEWGNHHINHTGGGDNSPQGEFGCIDKNTILNVGRRRR